MHSVQTARSACSASPRNASRSPAVRYFLRPSAVCSPTPVSRAAVPPALFEGFALFYGEGSRVGTGQPPRRTPHGPPDRARPVARRHRLERGGGGPGSGRIPAFGHHLTGTVTGS